MGLIKKKIKGEITIKTGLHIGGNNESFHIGGSDSPVIKDYKGDPYIPGSSLKGKLKSLLRLNGGISLNDLKMLFGSEDGPGCLIFRDSSVKQRENYYEIKPENMIGSDGRAKSPRFIERVVPDTVFELEIILNLKDEDENMIYNILKESFRLLENDALGGSGSRGYGAVSITSNLEDI